MNQSIEKSNIDKNGPIITQQSDPHRKNNILVIDDVTENLDHEKPGLANAFVNRRNYLLSSAMVYQKAK